MNEHRQTVSNLTRPKLKVLKWFLFGLFILIFMVVGWFGAAVFGNINKITADSGTKSSLLSLLSYKNTVKGEADGRTNILLLGNGGANHPGGGLTDTMIVLSIDWRNKEMAMISVPRDMWVKMPSGAYAKLNYTYFYGNQNAKLTGGGGKVASDTISGILGIPIHYYISLDFDGFKKAVDTLGGLDIYVEKNLYDPLYPAPNMVDYAPFSITAGEHHMNGDTALKYARSRETTSDFDRSARQQLVLAAIKEKVMSVQTLSNPVKTTDLMNILGTHLKTSLSVTEMMTLWDGIKTIDTTNMINKVFDTAAAGPLTSTQDERGYIIIPKKGIGNYTDLQNIAQNIFESTPVASPMPKNQNGF